jgi:hypothetical protein
MTPEYVEITFVAERDIPDSTPLPLLLDCARGRADAQYNLIIRISFCPFNGFAAEPLEICLTGYARTQWVPG